MNVYPNQHGTMHNELEGELTLMIEVSLDAERGPKNKKRRLLMQSVVR